MIRQELLGTAPIPGGQGRELKLYRHDQDFVLRLQGIDLMTSRMHGSEEMLAEFAVARLRDAKSARVLVGGLGMGYTLSKVLELTGPSAAIEVVELVPEIVDWNREWFGALNDNPLDDRRVELSVGDVVPRIRDSKARYDAILLDVDNGAESLTRSTNDRLYSRGGLAAARVAVTQRGVLAVWSSSANPKFAENFRRAGFSVTEERARARRTKGPRHTIWVGVRT